MFAALRNMETEKDSWLKDAAMPYHTYFNFTESEGIYYLTYVVRLLG